MGVGGGKGWVVKFSSLSKKVCKTGMTSLFYHGSSHLGRKRDKPEGNSPTYKIRQRRKTERTFC